MSIKRQKVRPKLQESDDLQDYNPVKTEPRRIKRLLTQTKHSGMVLWFGSQLSPKGHDYYYRVWSPAWGAIGR